MGAAMDTRDALSVLFAFVAVAGVVGGIVNRSHLRKGIGTQFIRYIAVTVSLPIAAALALQGMLTEAAVSVIVGVLGYVFAGVGTNATDA